MHAPTFSPITAVQEVLSYVSPLGLTCRTIVCGTPADHNPLDRLPAPLAGFASAPVHVQRARKVAGRTVDVHIQRVEAGSALFKSTFHHFCCCIENAVQCRSAQQRGTASGPHSSQKQRLVRVDIADSRDDLLVKQHRLNSRTFGLHPFHRQRGIERRFQRICGNVLDIAG